jgi:hypothetical protein
VNVVGLDLSLTATGVAWPDGTTETITTTPRDTLPDRLRYIRASIVEHLRDLIFLGPTVAVVEDLPYTRNQAGAQLGMVHGIMRVARPDAATPTRPNCSARRSAGSVTRGTTTIKWTPSGSARWVSTTTPPVWRP